MTESMELDAAWDRTAYEPGGGDALVFYVVYAGSDIAPSLDVSPDRHRTNGMPEGVSLGLRQRPDADWGTAEYAVGASAAAYAAAETAEVQFILAGTVEDPTDLTYLRDVLGIAAAIFEAGATAIFDIQTLRLFTADEFATEVFGPDAPSRDVHVAFLCSEDETRDGYSWFHTRGLRKFGRPDISIPGVAPDLADDAAELLHRFAELSIRGGVIPEGMRVRKQGWPEGWTCHHTGSMDDPDFNNVHVVIRAPLPS